MNLGYQALKYRDLLVLNEIARLVTGFGAARGL